MCGKDEFVCRFEECTPIHVAVYFRRAAVVALLLRSGADIERRAHKILFGTYNDEDEIDMRRWLYRDVSCLHSAVGGEECVPAKVEDLHQTLHHLVHHIRSLAHGTGGASWTRHGVRSACARWWTAARQRSNGGTAQSHSTSSTTWRRSTLPSSTRRTSRRTAARRRQRPWSGYSTRASAPTSARSTT